MLIGILILVALMARTGGSSAADSRTSEGSMRCGTRLVQIGDTAFEVLAKCGNPDHSRSYRGARIYHELYDPRRYPGRHGYYYRLPAYVGEYVEVEEWTYNLGPTRFIRYLIFENGKLVAIETGPYGRSW